MKTARFRALVEKSGKPSVHLAWAPPAKDAALRKALKENRLLTIHQQARGAKKDYAVIGLEVAHDAQYLVFPKSLRAFKDRKIVGIQYELLADSLSFGPTPAGRSRSREQAPQSTKAANVVLFPVPGRTPASVRDNVKPEAALPKTKTRAVNGPPPSAATQAIIRQALADLDAGYLRKAEQSLRSLLPGVARDRPDA